MPFWVFFLINNFNFLASCPGSVFTPRPIRSFPCLIMWSPGGEGDTATGFLGEASRYKNQTSLATAYGTYRWKKIITLESWWNTKVIDKLDSPHRIQIPFERLIFSVKMKTPAFNFVRWVSININNHNKEILKGKCSEKPGIGPKALLTRHSPNGTAPHATTPISPRKLQRTQFRSTSLFIYLFPSCSQLWLPLHSNPVQNPEN